MGNRLSKIYTRTVDDGTTGLGDGTRVPKDGERVEALMVAHVREAGQRLLDVVSAEHASHQDHASASP